MAPWGGDDGGRRTVGVPPFGCGCFVRNSEVSFDEVFRTLAEINVRSLPA
jgi:roadblock/LC7 domain-containing protein